jgi:hypothetical protein
MDSYSMWAHNLFPRLHTKDLLNTVDKWSGNAAVKVGGAGVCVQGRRPGARPGCVQCAGCV